jgi:hypothetical protein
VTLDELARIPAPVWALVGTVLGAAIGFGGNYFIQWRQRSRQQDVSRIQVANHLRHWLQLVLWQTRDTETWLGSDGHGGQLHRNIPAFRFEDDPQHVAQLDLKTALKVFDLVHKKDVANAIIEEAGEYLDDEDAIEEYRGRSAKLFLDALVIYDALAKRLGWIDIPFSAEARDEMALALQRFEEVRAKRLDDQKKLFEEISN